MIPERKISSIRFNQDLYEELKKEAEKLGVSINALINMKLSKTKGTPLTD